MLLRTLCASALFASAGAALAQQHEDRREIIIERHDDRDHKSGGVFSWTSDDDNTQRQRTVTIERTDDTVLVFSPKPGGKQMQASFTDGTRVIELLLDGDSVRNLSVEVDGKRVSNPHGKVREGKVIIYAPDESVIAEFMAPMFDGQKHEITWHGQPAERSAVARIREEERRASQNQNRLRLRPDASSATVRGWVSDAQPRRVIGIYASTPGEALAAQLGVKPDEVIVVDNVNKGRPAEKAGLQRFDVITRIDGDTPATVVRLQEVLASKGEGEPVRLTVLRGGKTQDIKVVPVSDSPIGEVVIEGEEVEELDFPFGAFFDDEDLTPAQRRQVEVAMVRAQEALATQRERLDELRITLEERMEDMSERLHNTLAEEGVAEEIREAYERAIRELSTVDVQRQIEQALAQVKQAVEAAGGDAQTLRSLPQIEFLERDANGRGVIVAPRAPRAPGAPAAPRGIGQARSGDDDARLKALEERMERIERLLERIADDRGR